MSYWDYTNRNLKYATNASGSWETETIDTEGDVGSYSSIAIDSRDRIHISYHKATVDPVYFTPQGDLKYATNASGSWVNETIEIGSGVTSGHQTSIAIDSRDRIHISYRVYADLSPSSLKYATNASGSWERETVDTQSGQFSSIAVDSNDKVHISYYSEELFHNDLMYATGTWGSWAISTIDHSPSAIVGYYTSIAVDSNDRIHISYYNSTGANLKYATNASGPWTKDTLDSAGSVGKFTSIAIDSNDKIHISYYDETNTNLKYATDASGSWENSTIDSDGTVGWETSIAVDSLGNLHISYYDVSNANLKYILITSASEPIPEFSDVLVPVVAMVLLVMVAGRMKARRKDSHGE